MSRLLIITMLSFISVINAAGQDNNTKPATTPKQVPIPPISEIRNMDSLKSLLANMGPDTNRVNLLLTMSRSYYFNRPDTCLQYSNMAMELSRTINYTKGLIISLRTSGEMYRLLGDFPAALKCQFEALELSEKIKEPADVVLCLNFIGVTYIDFMEYRRGLHYLFLAAKIPEVTPVINVFNFSNTGYAYDRMDMADSSLYYHKLAYSNLDKVPVPALRSLILIRAGDRYKKMGKNDSALIYFRQGLLNSFPSDDRITISKLQKKIAEIYLSMNKDDSAFFYAYRALATAQSTGQKPEIMEAADMLHHLYRSSGNTDSAFLFGDLAGVMKDKVFGAERFKQLQMLMMDEQERQQKTLREQESYKNKIRFTALISALSVSFLVGLLLFRNNRQKQKAKQNIEQAYTELKNTQIQLVQKEKMASLGELTAGIAHEIQNPLNFVNNFSEVNTELLDELKQEIAAGNLLEVDSRVNEIIENEKKIIHHGRRADTIVKGMLQHSRASTGTKEATDINLLAAEYLKLAQLSFKSKHQAFTAAIQTDYDPSIGFLLVLPPDLGKVILNLITNAFYAVTERLKKNEPGYEPIIKLSTKNYLDRVEIQVKDNGNGMTEDVLTKIFQPFFTTRTTGEGTGLGLSISYDIITKAHGGEIKVNSDLNRGSQFTIVLPFST